VTYRPLIPPARCSERLEAVFPRAAFDTVLSSPVAGAAVTAMLYVNAVVPDDGPLPEDARWARPSMCLWLTDVAYGRGDAASRTSYYEAASKPNKAKVAVQALHQEWGATFEPRYSDTTREPLRDETFPAWLDHGAVRVRPGVKTTSPVGRWALSESFADLFDPSLQGDALEGAIEAWRDAHMTPGARLKAVIAQQRAEAPHAVRVTLPNGEIRSLEPGQASVILKGVIEIWAPLRLADAVVLTISEPGDKVYTADNAILGQLGLQIDPTTLLPDALIADIGGNMPVFWIVEAVATDGPVTDDRKRALLQWATSQRIPADACRFLSAFASRNDAPARRRLKDIADDTFGWYADEPTHELAWYELPGSRAAAGGDGRR